MSTRVFVFEFVAGGGWRTTYGNAPPVSLRQEGLAMLSALVQDFHGAGCQVSSTIDAAFAPPSESIRWLAIEDDSQLESLVAHEARQADWTIVIAPEFEGLLARWRRAIREHGGRVLGCSERVIELCANKHYTATYLLERGIRAPVGTLVRDHHNLPTVRYPAVLKPVDGAGSCDVRLVETAEDADRIIAESTRIWRLEEFCPGLAASVSFLCGPGGTVPLAPMRQRLLGDMDEADASQRFEYVGGERLVDDDLVERALRLGRRAVDSLDGVLGYVGVDLVLGAAADGSEDVVIEINPRLTTSYVGMRAICRNNPALAMIELAEGGNPQLEFDPRGVWFDAQGNVTIVQRVGATR